jgi:hypothetical protein
MPTWEVRQVSGKGFIEDTPIAAYQDLDESGIADLKELHKPAHIGEIEQFVDLSSLKNCGDRSAEDAIATLQTSWKGKPLAADTVYCVVVAWENDPTAQASASVQALVEDRMVQAAKNRFSQSPQPAAAGSSTGAAQRPQSSSRKLRQKGRLRI